MCANVSEGEGVCDGKCENVNVGEDSHEDSSTSSSSATNPMCVHENGSENSSTSSSSATNPMCVHENVHENSSSSITSSSSTNSEDEDAFENDTTLSQLTSREDFNISEFMNDLVVIDYCLEHDICGVDDYVRHGDTLLHHAVSTNNIYMVKMLVEKFRANLEYKTKQRLYTPLIIACKNNNEDIIKYLVSHGALTDNRDSFGRTPLMYSCMGNHHDMINYLVSHGADVNVRDNDGNTPLMEACSVCLMRSVELLVEHGADITAKNKYKMSPIMIAAEYNEPETIRYLLEVGDTLIEKADKRKAFNLAKKAGNEECRHLLYKSIHVDIYV